MGGTNGRYVIHYLPARGGPLPRCVQGRGGISADTETVTCQACRGSLRFRMADFQRSYVALLRSLLGRRDGLP